MEVKLMKIIGLTGGSGTGKGTVAARMRALGAGWVDADAVYPPSVRRTEILSALDTAFGGVSRHPNGVQTVEKLAKIVFSGPAKLQQLNVTTVLSREASLSDSRRARVRHRLFTMQALFEAGADDFCDKKSSLLLHA